MTCDSNAWESFYCCCCYYSWPGRYSGNDRVQEYTPPYEVTDKDLNPLYGRYEIYEVDRYRGGLTTEAEAQARVG